MIYESAIIKFFLTVYQALEKFYSDSAIASIFRKIAGWVKILADNSGIWRFIKREDYLSRVWEYSKGFNLLNKLLNSPSQYFRGIYERFEDTLSDSRIFSLLKVLLGKFEILIGAFLVFAIIVPHAYWSNAYSMILVFFLAFLFFIKTVISKYDHFNIKAIDAVFFIFIIMIILAEVTSLFPLASLSTFMFYATCFMLVLIIVSSVKTENSLNLLIGIMLIGITISGLYGIWQGKIVGVAADPSLTDISLNEGMPGRVFSTMGNANNYAEVLILTIPFFFAMIFNAKTIFKKALFIIMAIPPLVSLVLTYSRSSWIAFAIAILVFAFLKNKKLIPLILLLGIASFPLLPQSVYRRIATIWNPNDTSGQYRILIYKTIQPMLKDYWETGVGLGPVPFMRVYQRYFQYTAVTAPHSHNLFLQIWFEAGIFGILSFIWFIARIVKKCTINIFNNSNKSINNIFMAAVASIAGISVMGMAEYVWFYPRVMLMFWMNIGIILSGLSILAVRKKELSSKSS